MNASKSGTKGEPPKASSPKKKGPLLVKKPLQRDVILGRGRGSMNKVGNRSLRLIVDLHLEDYTNTAARSRKTSFIRNLTDGLLEKGYRFLKSCGKGEYAVEENYEEIYTKVSHSFRDRRAFSMKWKPEFPRLSRALIKEGIPPIDYAEYLLSKMQGWDPTKTETRRNFREEASAAKLHYWDEMATKVFVKNKKPRKRSSKSGKTASSKDPRPNSVGSTSQRRSASVSQRTPRLPIQSPPNRPKKPLARPKQPISIAEKLPVEPESSSHIEQASAGVVVRPPDLRARQGEDNPSLAEVITFTLQAKTRQLPYGGPWQFFPLQTGPNMAPNLGTHGWKLTLHPVDFEAMPICLDLVSPTT